MFASAGKRLLASAALTGLLYAGSAAHNRAVAVLDCALKQVRAASATAAESLRLNFPTSTCP